MSARADALDHLVRGIVDDPDAVAVTEKSTRRGPLLEVRVGAADLGRVIGRSGRTARALRTVTVGLGGAGANGFARESGFDITVASEVMACLCLADDLADLEQRLARIVVAYTRQWQPVTAGDLKAAGAMTAAAPVATGGALGVA